MDLCCWRTSSDQALGTTLDSPSETELCTGLRAYSRGTREVFCTYPRTSGPRQQRAAERSQLSRGMAAAAIARQAAA
eukprot:6299723-Prymnesium_polylepis.1